MSYMLSFFSKKIIRGITRGELLYFCIWFVVICFIWNQMFYFDGQYYWAGWQALWGDWTTHIAYITNFAYRPFPLPYNPQFLGESFRYHFAADLLSGMLMKFGLSLVKATVLPSIICTELLIIVVYFFFLRLFKNRFTAVISSLLFFFNGGFGIIQFFYNMLITHHPLPPAPPVFMLTKNDEIGIRWMNFFLAEFVPQRAFLLGAPIAIYILTKLWEIFDSKIQYFSKQKLFFIGVLAGLLPVIHYQSFYVVLLITVYVCIISIRQHGKTRLSWFWLLVPLIVVFFITTITFFGHIPYGNTRLQTGSIGPSGLYPMLGFWFINLGVMTILIPLSFLKSDGRIRLFYIPFLLLFVISNVFVFQLDPWDNRKFLLYWYLLSSGLVGHFLYKMTRSKYVILALVLFYFATISGFIDAANLLNFDRQRYRMFSVDDMEFSQKIRRMTDTDDIFLTAPANTVSSLTLGRQIVMGWETWLQNYGYMTNERRRDIDAIYTGDINTRTLINKYSIDFIIVGQREREMYKIDEVFFQKIGTIFLQNSTTTIYDVRGIN